MRQNMSNFLKITDINTQDQLTVRLVTCAHGTIRYKIKINDIMVCADDIELKFDLFDPINLSVEVLEFEEGSSGLEIISFTINDLIVLPTYRAHASSPVTYIDKLGTWRYSIPVNFYSWFHRISGQGWIA